MSVTITFGSPNRWRRWTAGKGGKDSRPAPGTWFFEARYLHNAEWKVGLDFRPIDGKMPDFWQPPFLWRPAHEIEETVHQLGSGTGILALMGVENSAFTQQQLAKALDEYSEQAKNAKKLMFGVAYGHGSKVATIAGPPMPDIQQVPKKTWSVKGIQQVYIKDMPLEIAGLCFYHPTMLKYGFALSKPKWKIDHKTMIQTLSMDFFLGDDDGIKSGFVNWVCTAEQSQLYKGKIITCSMAKIAEIQKKSKTSIGLTIMLSLEAGGQYVANMPLEIDVISKGELGYGNEFKNVIDTAWPGKGGLQQLGTVYGMNVYASPLMPKGEVWVGQDVSVMPNGAAVVIISEKDVKLWDQGGVSAPDWLLKAIHEKAKAYKKQHVKLSAPKFGEWPILDYGSDDSLIPADKWCAKPKP